MKGDVFLTGDYIYNEAEKTYINYGTRDPFLLLDRMGAVTHFSREYGKNGLKGYSMVLNRTKYAVINIYLPEYERRIVAGHEAAHLIVHIDEITNSPVRMLKDFNLFDTSGRTEYQANLFLADFLISDDNVLESIFDNDRDFFSSARELSVPPELFSFKLFSMTRRGYKLQSPIDLDSKFLGR
ncbi:MAG: ImmA/IrrE family metallo-endopeptidase [Clostridiales bacterium]|jgi:Zn-dependent peptidase ImmA (M78 family)|nr:ImmA/IrrE family metallo-endopeptidase [Clostridiales bacterium]